jgi:D-3-phosphoglycerate dehydrogenase
VISADLQEPPELIATLVERWREGFRVVWTTRDTRAQSAIGKFYSSSFTRLFRAASGLKNYPAAGPSGYFLLDRAVKGGVWKPTMPRPIHDFRVQTLGIVGFGKIARATARKAQAFGLSVIAYDPYVTIPEPGVRLVSFEELLSTSDYICIHAALAEETRNLFSDKVFDRMKPSAYLINSARGPIVDEDALYRALTQGKIAGAALDTMVKEPPVGDHPLFSCPNIIITPHVAWYSEESIDLLRRENTRAVIDVLKGGRPKFLVNPEVLEVLEERKR